ncbi:MAG: response regulator [Candidatus Electryonea clarkiae]|nr:response regulator [Candidatus Electryonea clarkiae]MDP8289051.1 response regulator [Candidatus Electryonea clarkiae]
MKQTILIVDDEPDMLTLLSRIIALKSSYHVTTTINALEVPGLLENNQYDLIITDLHMPGYSGIDLLRQVREQNRHEEVIIITAFRSFESVSEAISLGAYDYITKPFSREQILYIIEKVMRWQRAKKSESEMNAILEMKPFEIAADAFKKQYIHYLMESELNDPKELSGISGLPVDDFISE